MINRRKATIFGKNAPQALKRNNNVTNFWLSKKFVKNSHMFCRDLSLNSITR